MIHEVLSDTRRIHHTRDIMFLQLSSWPNARSHEDGRTAIRASADNNFPLRMVRPHAAVEGTLHQHTTSHQLPRLRIRLNEYLVNCRSRHYGDVLARIPVRDKVGARRPQTFVHGPWGMSASVRRLACREHVGYMWQSCRDEGGHDELRDGSEIVRFGVQGAVVAVGLFVGVEPGFRVKCFCLCLG